MNLSNVEFLQQIRSSIINEDFIFDIFQDFSFVIEFQQNW